MENIVGIKFIDKNFGVGTVITWGNVYTEEQLLHFVEKCLNKRFNIELTERMEYCNSLTNIAKQPYFYECLIRFIQEPVPTGKIKYKKWIEKKQKSLKKRNDIYFNGFEIDYQKYLDRKLHGFPEIED